MSNHRKVNFFSIQVAQDIGVPVNMLSIGEGEIDLPVYSVEHKRVMRLEFDDIEEDLGPPYRLFDFTHAMKILRFVDECGDEDIVVHCHAGISRSAAVAKFLGEHMDFEVIYTPLTTAGGLSKYNKEVYRVLRLAHLGRVMGD